MHAQTIADDSLAVVALDHAVLGHDQTANFPRVIVEHLCSAPAEVALRASKLGERRGRPAPSSRCRRFHVEGAAWAGNAGVPTPRDIQPGDGEHEQASKQKQAEAQESGEDPHLSAWEGKLRRLHDRRWHGWMLAHGVLPQFNKKSHLAKFISIRFYPPPLPPTRPSHPDPISHSPG